MADNDAAYADLLPALSPLDDPDAAMLDRKATMAKLLGTDGPTAPPSWLDQMKAAQQSTPDSTDEAAQNDAPANLSPNGNVLPDGLKSRVPPAAPSIPASVTPSGDSSAPSMAGNNAKVIAQMQANYAKNSQDVQNEADQPDLTATTKNLEAARQNAAQPINAYDPKTGKVVDDYKPSFGQRLMRGVEGFAKGGVFGAIDPAIGGATPYGAPNAQYGRDVQQQQGRVASLDQQLKNAADNYKATSARLGQVAKDRTELVNSGKDVAGASIAQQNIDNKPDKPQTIEEQAYDYAVKSGKTPIDALTAVYGAKNVKDAGLPQQYLDAISSGDTTKANLIKQVIRDTSTQPKIDIHQAEEKQPGSMVMVPDGKGGFNAQMVHPGDNVAPGATNVAGMGAAGKAADKESKAAQSVVEDAETAHTLAREAEAGNAPADVDLALQFFKTMKGSGGAGIRFTQTEQNLIMGARNSAEDLQAVAQKVIGSGQKFTTDQRNKILKVIDIHADAARKHVAGGSAPAGNDAPTPGAKVRDYTSLGSH